MPASRNSGGKAPPRGASGDLASPKTKATPRKQLFSSASSASTSSQNGFEADMDTSMSPLKQPTKKRQTALVRSKRNQSRDTIRAAKMIGWSSGVILLVLAVTSEASLDWYGETCTALSASLSADKGSGCVEPGSIGKCGQCAYDDQCSNGMKCIDSWKKCYDYSGSCYGPFASCSDCPSGADTDVASCNCGHSDFPNNWVECNKPGTSGKDSYASSGEAAGPYSRSVNAGQKLPETDPFAQNMVCMHNYYRQKGAGLGPVKWNVGLAEFASTYVKTLKDKGCAMQHSTSSQRSGLAGFSYAGENIYMGSCDSEALLPALARDSVANWYGELELYQYGGGNAKWDTCSKRNLHTTQHPAVGHMTQVLWASTTDIGCDYTMCNGMAIILCVYGPGGNYGSSPAFPESAFCKLNKFEENDKFGGLPRCDGQPSNC